MLWSLFVLRYSQVILINEHARLPFLEISCSPCLAGIFPLIVQSFIFYVSAADYFFDHPDSPLHWHPRNGFWKDFQNALLFIGILASSLWLLCWSEFPSHRLFANKINFDLCILGWIYWWYLFALLRFTCASFTSHWTNARYVNVLLSRFYTLFYLDLSYSYPNLF